MVMMFWRELKVVLGWQRMGTGWREGRKGRGRGEEGEREGRGEGEEMEEDEVERHFTGCAGMRDRVHKEY